MRSDPSISRFSVAAALLACLWLAVTAPALAQQQPGRIIGRVLDADGAPVAGAHVELADSTASISATSGLDGRFVLPGVAPGLVTIRARMVGYQPKTVSGIQVRAGGAVEQNVTLTAAAVQLAEIEVTAEAERGSVNRALEEQRNANNIVNAITAEQIAKSPDSDAGQAVQRVAGVTVQEGKFVFVRGLGERYTTTELNGSRIPSPEPDRKVVPLDLFPSTLLEGITTSKTFTPEQAGDFSGASVNIKTREFPARRVLSVTVGGGFNDAAAGKDAVKAPSVGGEWFAYGPRCRHHAGNGRHPVQPVPGPLPTYQRGPERPCRVHARTGQRPQQGAEAHRETNRDCGDAAGHPPVSCHCRDHQHQPEAQDPLHDERAADPHVRDGGAEISDRPEHQPKQRRRHHRPDALRPDVGSDLAGRKAADRPECERDGRIDVGTGQMAQRHDHR